MRIVTDVSEEYSASKFRVWFFKINGAAWKR
jgi:hypothetical protein